MLKQCEDTHLGMEADRNWGEITQRTYVYDRLEKEVNKYTQLQSCLIF